MAHGLAMSTTFIVTMTRGKHRFGASDIKDPRV